MNKPSPEFEIDEPTVVDDQGRSPNKKEVIDPDAHEIEAGANRPGEQGISNRPQDEQDEEADAANGNESRSGEDSENEDGVSASDKGEAGNLGRDAGATQGNQKMNGPGDRSKQDQNKGQNQNQGKNQHEEQDRGANRSTQGGEADRGPAKKPGNSHANPINTQKKQPQGSGAGSDKRSVN
jgi:hypothetical protein